MIHVNPAAEPDTFQKRVREPGLRAIAEMVGEKPPRLNGKRFSKVTEQRDQIPPSKFPTYWPEVLGDLMEGYGEICAYSCFRIHPVTGSQSVDHFAPKSRRWDQIYEWRNYRLACSLLNASKNNFGDVLDPFEVEDGWFQLELVGWQVIPNPELNDFVRSQVVQTCGRLKLNRKEFRATREQNAKDYWDREVSLRILERESSFVARELRRHARLNPGDD